METITESTLDVSSFFEGSDIVENLELEYSIWEDDELIPDCVPGVLVKCDPSIKAIIQRINDQNNHDIIIEDIDDEHMLIKNTRHVDLKQMLKEVRSIMLWAITSLMY